MLIKKYSKLYLYALIILFTQSNKLGRQDNLQSVNIRCFLTRFLKVSFSEILLIIITSNNQRLASAFDDLHPRLSLLCDVIRPCKKNLRRMPDTRSKIHLFIQSTSFHTISTAIRIRSASSFVESNNINKKLKNSTVSTRN